MEQLRTAFLVFFLLLSGTTFTSAQPLSRIDAAKKILCGNVWVLDSICVDNVCDTGVADGEYRCVMDWRNDWNYSKHDTLEGFKFAYLTYKDDCLTGSKRAVFWACNPAMLFIKNQRKAGNTFEMINYGENGIYLFKMTLSRKSMTFEYKQDSKNVRKVYRAEKNPPPAILELLNHK